MPNTPEGRPTVSLGPLAAGILRRHPAGHPEVHRSPLSWFPVPYGEYDTCRGLWLGCFVGDWLGI